MFPIPPKQIYDFQVLQDIDMNGMIEILCEAGTTPYCSSVCGYMDQTTMSIFRVICTRSKISIGHSIAIYCVEFHYCFNFGTFPTGSIEL